MSTGDPAPVQDALPQGYSADLPLMGSLFDLPTLGPSGLCSEPPSRPLARSGLGLRDKTPKLSMLSSDAGPLSRAQSATAGVGLTASYLANGVTD